MYQANISRKAYHRRLALVGCPPEQYGIRLNGPWEDFLKFVGNVASGAVKGGTDAAKKEAVSILKQLEKDPNFKALLDKVKNEAKEGVAEQIKANAPQLVALIFAAGGLGGHFLGQSKYGVATAAAIAAIAYFTFKTDVE